MRSARDNRILRSDDGKLIGINLGADYCSEHEWGIQRLRELFGMKDKGYGLDKRTAHNVPLDIVYKSTKKHAYLIVGAFKYGGQPEKINLRHYYLNRLNSKMFPENNDRLITAWDEGSFGINVSTKEDKAALEELHKAIQNKDISIWLGGGGVFQNAGLVVAIRSNISQEVAESQRETDLDRERLEKAAEKTGIEKLLTKAGRRWFALSPKWADKGDFFGDRKNETKHPVFFLLNPMEQDKYDYGWFSVEELTLWAKNQGPVIKEKK